MGRAAPSRSADVGVEGEPEPVGNYFVEGGPTRQARAVPGIALGLAIVLGDGNRTGILRAFVRVDAEPDERARARRLTR